ncbi:hypothetical protein [Lysobacter korlensis]|uniref:hypothetical protein n=1 Tax=Lysobacter korlensis TaxID=553636 RepID=UPI0036DE995B
MLVFLAPEVGRDATGNSFRLKASHFSLLAQRKVTKRKRLSREVKIFGAVGRCTGIFRKNIHVPSKNARRRVERPSGLRLLRRLESGCDGNGNAIATALVLRAT